MKKVIIEEGKLLSFTVEVGTAVVWINNDTVAHQINSDLTNSDFKFDIGVIFPGETSSPVIFNVKSPPEGFKYGCGLVSNLKANVFVGVEEPAEQHGRGHDGDHAEHHGVHNVEHEGSYNDHFHGFVTNGKIGNKIYMTHTPIFADKNHHFQIILQSAFCNEIHVNAYNALRNSSYGNGKVQLFFEHIALIDIQAGKIKELTVHSVRYYPDVPTVREGLVMPSVPTVIPEFKGAKVKIEQVLHFRTFTPDMPYPEHLTYLLYGNDQEVFMDSFISRAPNFHSVAKLAIVPDFWKSDHHNTTLQIQIPSRKIVDVSPKTIKRICFLDNQTHLIWGIPSGALAPVDPLEREPQNNGNRVFNVKFEDYSESLISIDKLLHFDATRLLNEGLGF